MPWACSQTLRSLALPTDDVNRRGAIKFLGRGVAASLGGVIGIRDVVLDAARSSAVLRAGVEIPGLSQCAMVEAHQRLYRLATDYALTSDLSPILGDLVGLRDELHTTLTTRVHHPSDTRDLYVLLGAACVLLSSISHDLSEPLAGMTLKRQPQKRSPNCPGIAVS